MISSFLSESYLVKSSRGSFLYVLIFQLSRFFSTPNLCQLSILVLGYFINITFGWIFVCIFISTIIFLTSKSSFLLFFLMPFSAMCVSTSFTEVPNDLEAGASLTVSQENKHLICYGMGLREDRECQLYIL